MADHDHRCGTHHHPNGAAEGRLVTTDPVCGMSVKPDTAFRMAYAGNTYLFCCDGCLERFRVTPERYLDPAAPAIKPPPRSASSPGAPSGRYTCPMHPEVESPRPGAARSAGWRWSPWRPSVRSADRVRLSMHPDRRGPAGSCPICGMALEPRGARRRGGPTPSSRDMTRRFWVSAALTAPLLVAGRVHGRRACRLAGASVAASWSLADAGRAVGRLAVLRARLRVDRPPQPQHVHADRPGRRRSPTSTAWWRCSLPGCSRTSFRDHGGAGRRLLRGRGGHRHPGAARPGAGAAGPRPHGAAIRALLGAGARRTRASLARRRHARRTCRSTQVRPATGCACGPARRCRWTAWCIEGASAVDESMVTGEPMPVEKTPGDGHRRHGQRHRQPGHARRAGRGATRCSPGSCSMVAEAQRSRAPIQRLADACRG